MASVLVVDDDAGIRESAVMALRKVGHRVVQASDAASALQQLREHAVDVVVSDIYMPGEDGLALLQSIAERNDPPRVILMTARGTIETTALAKRIGAFDYIAKPFDLSELIARVAAAAKKTEAEPAAIDPAPSSRIVGSHPAMVEMYKAITRVASLAIPVLVLGESGSGKELVAQSIHDLGDRSSGPFVAINCGAIPDTLLESELFGATRGAYTDARNDRRGALSRADGGTLFLDVICDASPELQAKLLRAVQVGEVQRVGGGAVRRVDVRLVAASNRDVMKEVAAGRFREDLMYRLLVLKVHLPPLRERGEDVLLLLRHLVDRHVKRMGARPLQLSPGAQRRLLAYTWPGNVRELENCVQQMLVLHRGGEVVEESDLPDHVLAATAAEAEPRALDLRSAVETAERNAIIEALRRQGGNRLRAAQELGISERGLYLKLQKLGLSGSREVASGGGSPPGT